MIAKTPKPPYYAVIFTNTLSNITHGYQETAQLMEKLAKEQEGYLGHESARDSLGITVSYWSDLEAIKRWKNQSQHLIAQKLGKDTWYQSFKTRICLVERDYDFGLENS
ncbi:antibiotic biosynthesis monooxygenase family protein [Algoriphagus hitonicola]|uniref:Heme-degrading monooxygenase HmoA n=1 Tax=Algoriphagus hitonicola TaxID=435880 RepID=A0A1I2U2E0_9BACT|nr:antibiotic biosynthesis monooxygenase [Algoriphagus hitonicola]SFG68741.1 Heme-degrading monooxygenase HmoA [Algoriphagus hitonicola]